MEKAMIRKVIAFFEKKSQIYFLGKVT